jgi:HPt (histidine-containing phosphotransfer) domain-containing protein
MNEHIGKPFDLDHLVALLLRHTGRGVPSAAQPRATTNADAAPETVALDTAGALARMGQNKALLVQALRGFASDLQDAPAQMEHLLAQGQLPAARRLAHTLKGVAATVGATAFARLAAQAEDHLASTEVVSSDDAPITSLQQAAQATAALVERALNQLYAQPEASLPDAEAMAPSPSDPARCTTELVALRRLLAHSDMLALEAFAALRARHANTLPADALQALEHAVTALDFETALVHVDTLLASRDRT